jgi:hypothetical protein
VNMPNERGKVKKSEAGHLVKRLIAPRLSFLGVLGCFGAFWGVFLGVFLGVFVGLSRPFLVYFSISPFFINSGQCGSFFVAFSVHFCPSLSFYGLCCPLSPLCRIFRLFSPFFVFLGFSPFSFLRLFLAYLSFYVFLYGLPLRLQHFLSPFC